MLVPINRDVTQLGAHGIDIYSRTQKMCDGHVAPIPLCGMVRPSCSTHLLEEGYDIRTIQELLAHKDVTTIMIYTTYSTMVDAVSEAQLRSCN